MERQLVYFSGRVQGVGFRYSVRRISAGYDVFGYVQNLVDGRVKLVAEGAAAELDAFVREICQRMSAYISDFDVQPQDPTGEFDGFDIRF